MANETSFTASLTVSKGGATIDRSFSKSLDMTGAQMCNLTQNVGTSAEAITFGDISGAPEKLLIKNLDATNYVEIDSADTFDKFPQKLVAGDFILLSPQTGTIYAKANTAAVNILKLAVEA